MRKAEFYRTTEPPAQPTTREPQPPYQLDGEDGNRSPTQNGGLRAGPEPTPVTARRAYRGQLWERGTLVLENEGVVAGPIDGDFTTESVPHSPWREPEALRLRPDRELVFVPSGPMDASAEFPSLRVHQARTIVRVRPDTADRYGNLYKLLAAAECTPTAVGENLERLTWALVYGSITAAKRAERILRKARRLAAE